MKQEDLKKYFSHTETLLNHVFWFKQEFELKPEKEHLGTSINYNDIKERRDDFISELINTVSAWVYSKEKVNAIIQERLAASNGDYANASSFLTSQAFSKFRPGYPQGQFGELLLFNFIQYFFQSVPMLRKQRITTSKGHERFGADAIHFKIDNGNNVIVLGESKCYRSKYTFKKAFETSLKSIIATFDKIDQELGLYTYDDFIEKGLEDVAKKYKTGRLDNVKYELVCLVAYNETNKRKGNIEKEIKDSIKKIIEDRCKEISDDYFISLEENIVSRINYIIFPIWNLDEIFNIFQTKVGSSKILEEENYDDDTEL